SRSRISLANACFRRCWRSAISASSTVAKPTGSSAAAFDPLAMAFPSRLFCHPESVPARLVQWDPEVQPLVATLANRGIGQRECADTVPNPIGEVLDLDRVHQL